MPPDQMVIGRGTIILTLVLMSISALFAGLCAAYLYMIISDHLASPMPPVYFFVNIPILFAATFVLRRSLTSLTSHMISSLRWQLWICLALTLVFIALQIFGWVSFFRQVPLTATQARSFLFVLSALHLVHVVAGIPFLVRFQWALRGDVPELLFNHQPQFRYLRGLTRYWNFLDVLWILLVVILLAGYSIRWL